ncbi:MAG: HAD family phosphatase [Lachnospiraceae bacterium]|nr:HAD family phosphatase [Lachnospiraceae bacterium]MBP3632481.1 HAD family phosphatase [Oscillospiraceae bacterium]
MSKILFTDLDGTLLTERKEISAYTRQVLNRFSKAGHKLVLCSGRPLPSIQEVKETLKLDYPGMYLIGFNGGCIYECDTDRILYKDGLSMEQAAHILHAAREAGIYCHTYSDTAILSPVDGREIAFYRRNIHLHVRFADDPASLLTDSPCKCLAIELTDPEKLERFRLSLLPWAEGKCTLVYSNQYLLEIFPATAGKGASVKKLCSLLNIPLSDSLAAGDQGNDISMLQAAGTGIAMCNGTEDVKKAADIITPQDNDHDGLALVLEQYIK